MGDSPGPRPGPVLAAGVLLGAALGWVAFFGLPARTADVPAPTRNPAAAISPGGFTLGSPAPSFELQTANGDPVQLEQLRGSVVLLNFWATWCAPCRIEMPLLQSVSDQYAGDGLLVLGINFDETAEQVQEYAAELALKFPLLLDPGGAVQALYGVRGYPTTVLVDREGNLAVYHIGVLTPIQLDGYLEQAGLFQ